MTLVLSFIYQSRLNSRKPNTVNKSYSETKYVVPRLADFAVELTEHPGIKVPR